ETDYARYLTSGKKELEAYEESLQKASLDEQRKAEEERERAERLIAEKRMAIEEARQREEAKKRAEERRKRRLIVKLNAKKSKQLLLQTCIKFYKRSFLM
ncbi:MAG: hypothetical protein J6A37_03285, partial [Oscillospiraceae bacterium]|nr:hypothetical protein [Oscillospiraceae bacterium]